MAYVLRTFDSVSTFIAHLEDAARQSLCEDEWYTNMILGTAHDHLSATTDSAGFWSIVEKSSSSSSTEESSTAIDGTSTPTLAMFSKNKDMFYLCAFQPINSLSSNDIDDALAPILNELHSALSSPSEIKSLFGPLALLDSFQEKWKSIYAPQFPSLIPRAKPFLTVRVARASPSTPPLPQARSPREGLIFRPFTAVDLDDEEVYEQTFECVYAFMLFGRDDPNGRTRDATTNLLRNTARGANQGSDDISSHLLWICLDGTVKAGTAFNPDNGHSAGFGVAAEGLQTGVTAPKRQRRVLGYTFLGRGTPKTIAIRHVYTHPDARGSGVAAALVIAACGFWLQPSHLWLKHATEPELSREAKAPRTQTAAPEFQLKGVAGTALQDTIGAGLLAHSPSALAPGVQVDVNIGGAGSSPSKIDQQRLLGGRPQALIVEPPKGAKDFVCLFVSPENPQAERLYQRCGFELLDEYWGEVGWEGVMRGEFT